MFFAFAVARQSQTTKAETKKTWQVFEGKAEKISNFKKVKVDKALAQRPQFAVIKVACKV